MQVNDATLEAVLVQQFELGPDLIRQRALSATDEHRFKGGVVHLHYGVRSVAAN